MALREVLKNETGNVQQRAMTEKMLEKHNNEEAAEEKKAVVKDGDTEIAAVEETNAAAEGEAST